MPSGELDPGDLLGLPDKHRKLIVWLARYGPASAATLAGELGLSPDEVHGILRVLLEQEYISYKSESADRVYNVRFRSKPRHSANDLLNLF